MLTSKSDAARIFQNDGSHRSSFHLQAFGNSNRLALFLVSSTRKRGRGYLVFLTKRLCPTYRSGETSYQPTIDVTICCARRVFIMLLIPQSSKITGVTSSALLFK